MEKQREKKLTPEEIKKLQEKKLKSTEDGKIVRK